MKTLITTLALLIAASTQAQITVYFEQDVEVADFNNPENFDKKGNLKWLEWSGSSRNDGTWEMGYVDKSFEFVVATETERFVLQFADGLPREISYNLVWQPVNMRISFDEEIGFVTETW